MASTGSSPLAGAERMTLRAPASRWLCGLCAGAEAAGGLDHHVDAELGPWQVGPAPVPRARAPRDPPRRTPRSSCEAAGRSGRRRESSASSWRERGGDRSTSLTATISMSASCPEGDARDGAADAAEAVDGDAGGHVFLLVSVDERSARCGARGRAARRSAPGRRARRARSRPDLAWMCARCDSTVRSESAERVGDLGVRVAERDEPQDLALARRSASRPPGPRAAVPRGPRRGRDPGTSRRQRRWRSPATSSVSAASLSAYAAAPAAMRPPRERRLGLHREDHHGRPRRALPQLGEGGEATGVPA